MSIPELSNPYSFLGMVLLLFVIIAGRYFIVAGLFYLFFYRWFRHKWQGQKIGRRDYSPTQVRREIRWSLINTLIFAVTGSLLVWLWQQGHTRVYTSLTAYSWWWLPASLGIALLIDETYYYWVHRWLHRPGVFRKIHRIHHRSNVPSPWTAFAFHPLEGLLLSVPLPITLLLVPMHPAVILVQLTIMTFSSVINHLDIELYPADFHRHRLGKWIIGATHHTLHHQEFRFNFGLYFTFWDKWTKTESPSFGKTFDRVTKGKDRLAITEQ